MITRHFFGGSTKAYDYAIIYEAPEQNYFWTYENGYWLEGVTTQNASFVPFTLVEDSYENGIGVWGFKGKKPKVMGNMIFGVQLDDEGNIEALTHMGGFNSLFVYETGQMESHQSTITNVSFPDGVGLIPAVLLMFAWPVFADYNSQHLPVFESFKFNGEMLALGAVAASDLIISDKTSYIEKALEGRSFDRVFIDTNNPYYDSRDNCNAIIETSTNTLIAMGESATIPNGITTIGKFACYNSTISQIPNTVTSIGGGAFCAAKGTDIVIPNSVTSLPPGSTDGINIGCFSRSQFATITLPENIQLGSMCFSYISNVTINMPASVSSYSNGTDVFMDSRNITVNYGGTIEQWQTNFENITTGRTSGTINCSDGTITL